jgi:hypothetical protein
MLPTCTLFDPVEDPPNELPPLPTQTYPVGFLEGQFCRVQSVFEIACVTGCHSAVVPEGNLDLHTDPYNAVVYKPSYVDPNYTLVVPRDPAASLLYQKVMGLQSPEHGGVMPPQGVMDPYFTDPIGEWILAGAPNDCEPPVIVTDPEVTRHHPLDWAEYDQHGPAAKLQTDGDCRSCHGEQLDGAGTAGVSCDECHVPGWRTDCTYCHGGTVDQTGAPPRDVDEVNDPYLISFTAHSRHVDSYGHYQYGCNQCHYKPTDVLTPGHVFDDVTPAYGEMDYTAGLSKYATYYQGTCSNVACHGTGITAGEVTDGDTMYCYSCHPDQTSQPNDFDLLSGHHRQHLQQGAIYCSECHSQVVDAQQNIIGANYHVDGTPQVLPVVGMTYYGGTCNGTCHNELHENRVW